MPTAESAMSQRFFTGPPRGVFRIGPWPRGHLAVPVSSMCGAGGAMPAGPLAQKRRLGESQPSIRRGEGGAGRGPECGDEWPRPPGSPARSVLEMALQILCGDAEVARCGLRLTSGLASDGRELLTALGRTLRAGQYRRSCDPGLTRMGLSAEAVVLALAWGGAVAGGGAVTTVLGPWYRGLVKPAWQPPDWAVRSRPRRARQRPWSSRTSNRTPPGARVVCLHRLDRARSASARGPAHRSKGWQTPTFE